LRQPQLRGSATTALVVNDDTPRPDAEYAVMHHVDYEILQPRRTGEQSFMFVGLPHPQALRHLEVGVTVDGRGRRTVFRAMEVTDLYRHIIPRTDH
jgi:hypothetical protein avisC_01788